MQWWVSELCALSKGVQRTPETRVLRSKKMKSGSSKFNFGTDIYISGRETCDGCVTMPKFLKYFKWRYQIFLNSLALCDIFITPEKIPFFYDNRPLKKKKHILEHQIYRYLWILIKGCHKRRRVNLSLN